MASTNPARGMRDFLPADVRKRNYVINIIKEVYEAYGFEPLETPAVENIETLLGKYGEEGNQLVFKILKRGEKLQPGSDAKDLADLALRYDLTVPLARVIANNKNELPKFFKRYQIQPVWRADRPARGRFREFYQCDVDAIGSTSMIVEAELISAASEILIRLGFEDFIVKFNSRRLLSELLGSFQIPPEVHGSALTILDKADKIGVDGMTREFGALGYSDKFYELVEFVSVLLTERRRIFRELDNGQVDKDQFSLSRFNSFILLKLAEVLPTTKPSKVLKIFPELVTLLPIEFSRRIEFDPILARGISYYTGSIMEIVLSDTDFPISLAGGGRYDGLIGMFGKEQIPACGFSLGLERILVVMEERAMFPSEIAESTPADVMVTIWSDETIVESLKLAAELRSQGIRVTVYPEADKLGKQFKYADSIKVPWVCVLGESEIAERKVMLKNMVSGKQEFVARIEAASRIQR